jgi:hypothetical protein
MLVAKSGDGILRRRMKMATEAARGNTKRIELVQTVQNRENAGCGHVGIVGVSWEAETHNPQQTR